jgi:hypothetical protein
MDIKSHRVDLLYVKDLGLSLIDKLVDTRGYNHGDYLGLLEELIQSFLSIFGILHLTNDDTLLFLFTLEYHDVRFGLELIPEFLVLLLPLLV